MNQAKPREGCRSQNRNWIASVFECSIATGPSLRREAADPSHMNSAIAQNANTQSHRKGTNSKRSDANMEQQVSNARDIQAN